MKNPHPAMLCTDCKNVVRLKQTGYLECHCWRCVSGVTVIYNRPTKWLDIGNLIAAKSELDSLHAELVTLFGADWREGIRQFRETMEGV